LKKVGFVPAMVVWSHLKCILMRFSPHHIATLEAFQIGLRQGFAALRRPSAPHDDALYRSWFPTKHGMSQSYLAIHALIAQNSMRRTHDEGDIIFVNHFLAQPVSG
jgi:hypothetical protein